MRIALIDDGIKPDLCPNLLPEYDLCVQENGKVMKRPKEKRILTNHGTTSARIICRYAPGAELCSLQVFDSEGLKTSIGRLLTALEWCYREKIPIIHLSLGSTFWMDYNPLRRISAKLIQNGRILIAAHSNSNDYTMPACFMGILGVMTDKVCRKDGYYIKEAGWEQVQVYASSRHILKTEDNLIFETQVSNSYAAPVITAKVHEILCGLGLDRTAVPEIYQRLAGQKSSMFRLRPDFIEDVILFQPGDHHLLYGLFFFSVSVCVNDLSALKEAVNRNPYTPVVLIPSGSYETDEKACRLCWENCRLGFLYAGEAVIKAGNDNLLFWDEWQYRDFFYHAGHVSDGIFQEDTARLMVEGEDDFPLLAAERIKAQFQENDYPCVIVSDYPYAYLYGMEYLPRGMDPEDFAMDVAAIRKASVVIYCLKENGDKKPEYDFRVFVKECEEMAIVRNRIYLPKLSGDREVKRLYQYILEYEDHECVNGRIRGRDIRK